MTNHFVKRSILINYSVVVIITVNDFIKKNIKNLKPSSTLAINEKTKKSKKEIEFLILVSGNHHFQYLKKLYQP